MKYRKSSRSTGDAQGPDLYGEAIAVARERKEEPDPFHAGCEGREALSHLERCVPAAFRAHDPEGSLGSSDNLVGGISIPARCEESTYLTHWPSSSLTLKVRTVSTFPGTDYPGRLRREFVRPRAVPPR